MLPAPNAAASNPADCTSWSGLPWVTDAEATSGFLARYPTDWLVVDHYGLDARWERAAIPDSTRCLVIDDLADRPHIASQLVDSSLGRQPEAYAEHVPVECELLLGPQYALLRPEFAASRAEVLPTRAARVLRHILIARGGVDLPNASGAVLEALGALKLPDQAHVTIVLGRMSPHLETVRAWLAFTDAEHCRQPNPGGPRASTGWGRALSGWADRIGLAQSAGGWFGSTADAGCAGRGLAGLQRIV